MSGAAHHPEGIGRRRSRLRGRRYRRGWSSQTSRRWRHGGCSETRSRRGSCCRCRCGPKSVPTTRRGSCCRCRCGPKSVPTTRRGRRCGRGRGSHHSEGIRSRLLRRRLRRRRRRVKTSEPKRIVSRRGGRLHLRGPLRNLDPGEHTAHLLRLLLLRGSLLGNPRLRTLCLELLLHEDQLDELSQCCLVGVCWQGQVVLMLGAEPAGEPPGACGIVTPLPHHLHLLRLERGVGHGLDSELVLAVDPAARVAHEGSEGEDAVVGHALRARHAPLIALLFKHCAQFLLILLVLAGRLVHDASELSPDRDLLPQKAQKKVAGRETSAANRRPSTAGFVRTLEAARGKSSPALEGRDNRHVRQSSAMRYADRGSAPDLTKTPPSRLFQVDSPALPVLTVVTICPCT